MFMSDINARNELRIDLLVEVHLTEYQKLRDELVEALKSQQQTVVIALGSASIAIPILVGQSGSTPAHILAALLFGLGAIYAILAMNFSSAGYTIGVIGRYINTHLEVQLNDLLGAQSVERVLSWESFLRNERSGKSPFILSSIGTISSLFLILLPSFLALVSATNILMSLLAQPAGQAVSSNSEFFWLDLLSVFSWTSFLLGVLSALLLTVYNVIRSRWASKKSYRRIQSSRGDR